MNKPFDDLILAALVKDAYWRGSDDTCIAKLGSHYAEAHILAERIRAAARIRNDGLSCRWDVCWRSPESAGI